MKTLAHWLSVVLLLVGTLGGGLLHGHLTNRWGHPPDATLATQRFGTPLPDRMGHWRLVRDVPFEPEVLRILKCSAYISRIYEHEQSGDVISVAVLLGPPGSISVHTPEVCYASLDYYVVGERKKTLVKDVRGGNHSVWDVEMQSKALSRPPLRVKYAWYAGQRWDAAEHPRFRFGGLPHLYKIQIACGSSRQSAVATDPGSDFLTHLFPPLDAVLTNQNGSQTSNRTR